MLPCWLAAGYRPLRPNQETIALYAVWRAGDKNPAIAPFVRNLKDAAESLDDPQQDVPPAAASSG